MQIMLRLQYPISANRYWRQVGGRGRGPARMVVSEEAKTYKREVATAARLAGVMDGLGDVSRSARVNGLAGRERIWPAPAGQAVEVCIQLLPRANKQTAAEVKAATLEMAVGRPAPELRASEVCLDLDNCIKVTLDSLNGIAWVDDRQVKRISAEVGPATPGGGLRVWISRIEAGDTSSVCPITQEVEA